PRSEEGKLILQIHDFLPPDCSDGVEARLLNVSGVRAASLNPMTGIVTITLAPEGSSEAVVQRLRELGVEGGERPSTVKSAATARRARTADMAVLASLAVLSGFLYSVAATFLFVAPDFYWEVSTLVLFRLFGPWMEMRSVRGASGALRELVRLIPPSANRVK